jgi:hypothetical protein
MGGPISRRARDLALGESAPCSTLVLLSLGIKWLVVLGTLGRATERSFAASSEGLLGGGLGDCEMIGPSCGRGRARSLSF